VKLADRYFPSFKLKSVKSDGPEIFYKVLNRLKIEPTEAIFIDDRKINVKNAKKAGLLAILFKDLKDLRIKVDYYMNI